MVVDHRRCLIELGCWALSVRRFANFFIVETPSLRILARWRDCNSLTGCSSSHSTLELMPVRLGPGQFEFEMRFRSVRVQRLPRFAIDRHAAEIPFL